MKTIKYACNLFSIQMNCNRIGINDNSKSHTCLCSNLLDVPICSAYACLITVTLKIFSTWSDLICRSICVSWAYLDRWPLHAQFVIEMWMGNGETINWFYWIFSRIDLIETCFSLESFVELRASRRNAVGLQSWWWEFLWNIQFQLLLPRLWISISSFWFMWSN